MIYKPREDTYLLKKQVESLDLEDKNFLEIGTGSGLIAETALNDGADVTASDVNSEALENMPEGIKTVESNLFENIEGKFDYIVFNPPYLPGEKSEKDMKASQTWLGGEKGVEVAENFLEKSRDFLKSEGEVFLVLSSLSEHKGLVEKFDLEVVDEEKLFFERLFVVRCCVE